MEKQEIMIPQGELLKVNFKAENFQFENKDELAKLVDQIHDKYKDLVVTENDIAESKKTRADINRMKTAINSERIKVEKAYNEPLNGFKNVIKEFIKKLDISSKSIDEGVKYFENEERQHKADRVNQLVSEIATENDINVFEIEMQQRWLNKTATLKAIRSDVEQQISDIKQKNAELAQKVEAVKKQCEHENLDPYAYISMVEVFPLTQILSNIANDAETKRAREQAAKEANENKQQIIEEVTEKVTKPVTKPVTKVETKQKLQQVGFTLQATEQELNLIADFIVNNTKAKVINHTERKDI